MKLYTAKERKAERFSRVCSGKRKYETEEDAHAEAKRLRKRLKMKMQPYFCSEFCQLWHLGHNRKGGKRIFLELTELVSFQRKYGS